MSISNKLLDGVERQHLDALMVDQLGFAFARGNYYKTLENGVIQLILFQLHRSKDAFRVLVGLDSTVLSGQADPKQLGAYLVRYLDPAGITDEPHRWLAFDEVTAAESVRQIQLLIEPAVLPWFEQYSTSAALAEALGDEYDFLKAKLLLADGERDTARQYLTQYRRRLTQMEPSPEVSDTKREVDELLSGLSEGD